MAEYHVGCGLFGIYAGTLSKAKDKWLHKSNVTDEATAAVAQYLLQERKKMRFEHGGKSYILQVTEDGEQ